MQKLDPDDDFAQEKEIEQVDDDEPQDENDTSKVLGIKKRTKPRIIRYVNFNVITHEEEHFREKLLLFYPFRNLSMLKLDCNTFKERYEQVQTRVDYEHAIYSKYESEFAGLERVQNREDDDEDNEYMENLAPNAEQLQLDGLEHQREAEQNLPLPERVPSALISRSYHHENEWSENAYHAEVSKLNKKQFQFVSEFLFHLKCSQPDKQLLWFLSGGAGVGKTTAVNVLYQAVRRHFNSLPGQDHSSLQIVKCAFTGKASHQVQGYTINTLFKMPFGRERKREELKGSKLAELQSKLGNLKVLIVDEISMVDNDMWNDMSYRLRQIKEQMDVAFGGVHVLAVGDLFQLPPVKGRRIWEMGQIEEETGKVKGHPLGTDTWIEEIRLYEFDEIMRQKDEKAWAEFLNRLRESPLTDDDCNYIKEQIIARDHPIVPDANYITLTNDRCDQINDQWFHLSPPDKQYVLKSEDIPSVNAPIPPETILYNIENIKKCEVQNLAATLNLALEQEYDFVINLDTTDGLTNGTPCIAKQFQSTSLKGPIVWVDPQNSRVGKLWRQNHRNLYGPEIPSNWLPVLQHAIPLRSKYFTRKQFPLRASKARTVDRTQGATLNKIIVDFSDKRNQTAHCHYVAFSRCPSKANVAILGFEGFAQSKIRHDEKCISEMHRLRKESNILRLSLPCMANQEYVNGEYLNIYFLNAQSIVGKLKALEKDWNIRGSMVVGIADTRFEVSNEINLENFTQPPIYYSNDARPSLGIAVYSKMKYGESYCCQLVQGKGSIVIAKFLNFFTINGKFQDLFICFIYILPDAISAVYSDAVAKLTDLNPSGAEFMIIMGDFNKNPENIPSGFKEGMSNLGMQQLITGMTHNRGNTLDHIYTNICKDGLRFGQLNSLTKTDHLPIYVSLKSKINT